MRKRKSGIAAVDWMTFSIYISLLVMGWLMIFAATYDPQTGESISQYIFNLGNPAGKQLMWIGISVLVFFVSFLVDGKFWHTFAYLIYALAIALLIGVLLFGVEIKGARSWFSLGGAFSLQPSELAKFGTCLAVASYLSGYSVTLKKFRHQLITFGLFVGPMFLILLQPDAGSAAVFFAFLLVMYRAGMAPGFFIFVLSAAALFIFSLTVGPVYVAAGLYFVGFLVLLSQFKKRFSWALALLLGSGALLYLHFQYPSYRLYGLIAMGALFLLAWFSLFRIRKGNVAVALFAALAAAGLFSYSTDYAFKNILKPHQQDRLNVWLKPSECDPKGALYNALQSKMAISSGGLSGKGYLKGTMTKLNYVPEQSTDFIFCTIGEEQGFIGSVGIIILFMLLLMRIVVLGERQRSDFSRYYAYGVAGILFIHVMVNIGMTMGLLPIIGIPLPFLSYGGSSLLGFTLLLGVLIRLDSSRFE